MRRQTGDKPATRPSRCSGFSRVATCLLTDLLRRALRILDSPPPGSVPAVALCLPRGDGMLLRRPSPRIPPPLAFGSRVAPAGACGFAAGGEGSPTAREGVKEGR